MPDPGTALATFALEAQRASLSRVIAQLDNARRLALPSAPSQQWRGVAQAAYETRLHELVATFGAAVSAVQLAYAETDRAIATLTVRGG